MSEPHYSMLIEWSNEDDAFLVTLPEWSENVIQPVTHGTTYAEAVEHGREALEDLIDMARERGEPLPAPRAHASAGA